MALAQQIASLASLQGSRPELPTRGAVALLEEGQGAFHVVHLSTVHRALDTRIFEKECRTLAETGYRVTLIAPHTGREMVDGVEIIPMPRYPNRLARMILGPLALFRLARRLPAAIYHFHDPELLPVGVLLKWTTLARVVYDVHENHARKMMAREWIPGPLRRGISVVLRGIERISVGACDALVCVTEHIAALFPHSRTSVIKNYPLLGKTSKAPDPCQYRPDNHTLIYTGGWTAHRGVYQIVQALAYVRDPDVRLLLLGRCIDPEVQQEAAKLPAFDRVDYLGLVPYDQLYDHMRHAAIGMICSQPEHDYALAQPNKLFEYMSAGLPVIASAFPLWQDIVEGNACGLTVDPTKPKEIARVIDDLLASPERRRAMGARGCQAVLDTYNWRIEGRKLIDLYKELL